MDPPHHIMIIDREQVVAALPGYTVGAQLGRGAFGLVLAGQHRRMGRPVAIKVMAVDGAEGVTVTGFAAEARTLAGLDHPHIVRIYDYDEVDGLCLVVLELLPGGTLTRRRGDLSPPQGCAVGLAVATALHHAHSRGVLHRDIKADNILFAADSTVKVGDFGIAKLFEGVTATASGIAGTPLYMAPEQIDTGRLSPATDLYSLGVVLYQLLAGRLSTRTSPCRPSGVSTGPTRPRSSTASPTRSPRSCCAPWRNSPPTATPTPTPSRPTSPAPPPAPTAPTGPPTPACPCTCPTTSAVSPP
ncbi:serine/threonine-protein kinase, partial [Protofrankia symbiont of Coriaria myrtifolia]